MALLHSNDGRRTMAGAALVLSLTILTGCSSLIESNPLTATREVRSSDNGREGSYPAVGVTPPAPGTALSPAERAAIHAELASARAKNQAVANTPLTAPVR